MGELFLWTSKLSLGIDKIDEQHKKPVALTNPLRRVYVSFLKDNAN